MRSVVKNPKDTAATSKSIRGGDLKEVLKVENDAVVQKVWVELEGTFCRFVAAGPCEKLPLERHQVRHASNHVLVGEWAHRGWGLVAATLAPRGTSAGKMGPGSEGSGDVLAKGNEFLSFGRLGAPPCEDREGIFHHPPPLPRTGP